MIPQERSRAQTAGALGTFRLFGVPVRLHFTFILLLIFLVIDGLGARQSNASYVLFLLAIFASVILHELGHAIVARRFGIRTIEIVMFPIGGVSRLERLPAPKEELWIALTGPLVNLAIAAVLFLGLAVQHQTPAPAALTEPNDSNLLARIMEGNLILALFNLLPAFPMDGGRAMRAILARFKPENEATRLAAWSGRMLAIAMGLYGLFTTPMLVFIAFFVYLGAAQESAAAMGRSLTHGIPVRAAMVREFHTLSPGQTIRDAANLLLATSQQDFPVVHGNQVIGLLGRNALLRSMAVAGPDAYVAGSMEREFPRLSPDMDLAEVLPLMANSGSCALVMAEEELQGLLTTENLSQFLLLRRFGMEPVQAEA